MKNKVLELGGVRFNADYLRSVSEKKAISDYAHLERDKVVNAWKQANGLSKRNFAKPKAKKKAEKVETPKEESTDS